jgi:hypothetical protein
MKKNNEILKIFKKILDINNVIVIYVILLTSRNYIYVNLRKNFQKSREKVLNFS